MMNITASFLVYLKQIDKTSSAMQRKLHGAMKNHELIQMLELEKSLIYFSTSLKSNDVTMNKILRGRVVKLYEEDQDLLEDVLIELNRHRKWRAFTPESCPAWWTRSDLSFPTI